MIDFQLFFKNLFSIFWAIDAVHIETVNRYSINISKIGFLFLSLKKEDFSHSPALLKKTIREINTKILIFLKM